MPQMSPMNWLLLFLLFNLVLFLMTAKLSYSMKEFFKPSFTECKRLNLSFYQII